MFYYWIKNWISDTCAIRSRSVSRFGPRPGGLCQLLEPRILYSAGPLPTIIDPGTLNIDLDSDSGQNNLNESPEQWMSGPDLSRHRDSVTIGESILVVIDESIDGFQSLADSLEKSGSGNLEFLFLNSEDDPFERIGEWIRQYENPTQLHLFSHGSDGKMELGGRTIDARELEFRAGQIRDWQNYLATGADLYLYGCNIAETAAGEQFVSLFSSLAGVDIAASSDLTGNQALGGDWILEFSTGETEQQTPFENLRNSGFSWDGLLATITVTSTNDVVNGDPTTITTLSATAGADGVTLREAIIAANNTPGVDTINFSLGPGIATIDILSRLPEIDDQVVITGGLLVELNGANAGNHDGLIFAQGSSNSIVSGLIINRFGKSGIVLDDVDHVTIAGNYIGTDVTGMLDRGNGENGIEIKSGSFGNTIGGSSPASQNLISGNDLNGILIDHSFDNQILGNLIGTDLTGSGSLGNSQYGILLKSGASNNRIGGIGVGEGNTIAFNGMDGVAIRNSDSDFNTIRGNSFFSNSGLAIDLNEDGVTANDAGDNDNNENNLLNFPVIERAGMTDSGVFIKGTLNSVPGTSGLIIDFYWSPVADVSSHGEARYFLGSTTVNTDSNGDAAFRVTFNGQVLPNGSFVTATTTDPDGNTSEFALNAVASTILANTSEIRVNSTVPDDQVTSHDHRGSHRAVGIAENGDYVVVWSANNQDGSGWGVFGRRFDSGGSPLGGEFRVNSLELANEQHATVAMNSSGRFVVSWVSDSGGDSNVYYRVFNADGTAAGGDLLANTTTIGVQRNASVSMNSAGNFVIVWEGNGEQSGNIDNAGIFGQRFDASGARTGTEFLVNSGILDTLATQREPAVSMNSSGQFAVVYSDIGGIHARRFNSDGTLNGSRIDVSLFTDSGEPSIAMAEDGSLVVAWRQGTSDQDVFLRRYNAAGNPVGTTQRVSTSSALNQAAPSISMDAEGNFIVVWEGNGTEPGETDSLGIFGQKFDSSGNRIEGEFRINQTITGTQSKSSVAMLDPENFVVVWSGNGTRTDHADTSGVFARQFASSNNLPLILNPARPVINEDSSYVFSIGDLGYSDINIDPLDHVLIKGLSGGSLFLNGNWISASDLVSAADISAGNLRFIPELNLAGLAAAGVEFRVHDGTNYSADSGTIQFDITPDADHLSIKWGDFHTPADAGGIANSTILGDQQQTSIASLAAGGFVTVWQSTDAYMADGDDGQKIYLQRYDDSGSKIGGEIRITGPDANPQSNPKVAGLADGGFIVIWEGGVPTTDIWAQRFSITGQYVDFSGVVQPGPTPFLINHNVTANQFEADVTATSNGFFVAWATTDASRLSGTDAGIVGKFFDLNGNGTEEFQLNQTDIGVQRSVQVTALNADRVLVTWVDQNTTNFDLRGTIVSVGQTVQTPDFAINQQTANRQVHQSVASLGDKGFVVTWQSAGGDGDSYGIMARRFNLDGIPIDSSEVIVNSITSGNQTRPTVTGTPDGSYTVLWQTWGIDGEGLGIASRRFDADTGTFGAETRVNAPQAGHQEQPSATILGGNRIAFAYESRSLDGSRPEARDVLVSILEQATSLDEDTTVRLDLGINLSDDDGSEVINSITLSEIHPGATVFDGVHSFSASASNTSVDISAWNLSDLRFTPGENFHGNLTLKLTVVSSDGGANRTSASNLHLDVRAVNDAIEHPDFNISTNANTSHTFAANDVLKPDDDPDIANSIPPVVSPLYDYVATSSSDSTVNGLGQILWSPTASGPPIIVDGAATLQPSSSVLAGRVSHAFDIAGTTGATIDLAGLNSNNFGFEIWLEPDTSAAARTVFEWGTSANGIAIYQYGTTIRAVLTQSTALPGQASTTVELAAAGMIAGEFNQVMIVVDSSGGFSGESSQPDFGLFLNGKLVDLATDIPVADPGGLVIDSRIAAGESGPSSLAGIGNSSGGAVTIQSTGSPGPFEGSIARVAVFDQALSAIEIQNRFEAVQHAVRLSAIDGNSVSGPADITIASGALVRFLVDGSLEYDPGPAFGNWSGPGPATDHFTYTVVDQTGSSRLVTVNISVNTAPDTGDDWFSVGEDSILTDTVITNDIDFDGNSVVYSLLSSPGNGTLNFNPDGSFTFTPGTHFDYLSPGNSAVESFQYQAIDSAGNLSVATATITVHGVNDSPVIGPHTFTINENSPNNSLVGQVIVADVDDLTHSFSIVSSSHPFAINNSGNITVANSGVLDYETASSYSLVISATDAWGAVATQTISINVTDVNEFSVGPVTDVDAAVNQVHENAAIGTLVGITAAATDGDASSNTITYSLVNNGGGRFSIDSQSGVVRLASSLAGESGPPARMIRVRATSADGSFSQQNFSINITYNNDFSVGPITDADISDNEVNENAAIGTPVGITAFARDDDASNNTVTYTLTDDDDGRFSIDTGTGVISVAGPLDRESDGAARSITVRAASVDGSFSDRRFTIRLNDIDEFDTGPVIDINGSANEVVEGAAIGTVVGVTAFATDRDATNSRISYSLTDNDGGKFSIDRGTGVVRVAGKIDLSKDGPTRSITVRANSADGSHSEQSFTIAINEFVIQPNNDNTNGTNVPDGKESPASDPDPADDPTGEPIVVNPAIPDRQAESPGVSGAGNSVTGSLHADTMNNQQSVLENLDDTRRENAGNQLTFARTVEKGKRESLETLLYAQGSSIENTRDISSGEIDNWFDNFLGRMNDNREQLIADLRVGSPGVVSTAAGLLAVGYLSWAIKGSGALLSAFVSSLPAWQSFDPLPILQRRVNDDDDTSLEQMVEE